MKKSLKKVLSLTAALAMFSAAEAMKEFDDTPKPATAEILREVTKTKAEYEDRLTELERVRQEVLPMIPRLHDMLENSARISAIRNLDTLDPKAEKNLLEVEKIQLSDPEMLTKLYRYECCERGLREAEQCRVDDEKLKRGAELTIKAIDSLRDRLGNELCQSDPRRWLEICANTDNNKSLSHLDRLLLDDLETVYRNMGVRHHWVGTDAVEREKERMMAEIPAESIFSAAEAMKEASKNNDTKGFEAESTDEPRAQVVRDPDEWDDGEFQPLTKYVPLDDSETLDYPETL